MKSPKVPRYGVLNDKTVQRLFRLLPVKRRRFGFAYVIRRWHELVTETPSDAMAARRGRPRLDDDRYAVLWLAVIFSEYTRRKPTRLTRINETAAELRDKQSPFYKFASECLKAIGRKKASVVAMREATERWDKSLAFSKRGMRKVLFGGLRPRR